MTDYFDLGKYHKTITTLSIDAQRWFDRGLIWCYAFNQEEAVRCFHQVIDADPDCAMGYWGVAYASGPFYNKPWEWYGDDERPHTVSYCHQYADLALQKCADASGVEKALIEALQHKHPDPHCEDMKIMQQWIFDYADAMRDVYQRFNNDLEVICLFAEALMNLTPWKLWNFHEGTPAEGAFTLEAIDVLEHGMLEMDKQQPHPGLLHLYIHIYEMSPYPEKALERARQLTDLSPEAGHLVHMSSHILSLCGLWSEALEVNRRATAVDGLYVRLRGKREFYLVSVMHNLLYKMWAAMFVARLADARAAADSMLELITDDVVTVGEDHYLPSTIEGFHSEYIHLMVRFGLWQQLADEAFPDNRDLYPMTTIMLCYGKAIANAALGNLVVAREYQDEFMRLYELFPDWHITHNNPTRDILAVAREMMHGEVEYHAGNVALGFEHLGHADYLHDNLVYCEPWSWMHPPRHALGALLLEQNRIEEALMYYEDDLGISSRLPRCVQHRDNIWALHGYHECLTRLGRDEEALAIKPKLDALNEGADFVVSSSCGCRGMEATARAANQNTSSCCHSGTAVDQ